MDDELGIAVVLGSDHGALLAKAGAKDHDADHKCLGKVVAVGEREGEGFRHEVSSRSLAGIIPARQAPDVSKGGPQSPRKRSLAAASLRSRAFTA